MRQKDCEWNKVKWANKETHNGKENVDKQRRRREREAKVGWETKDVDN